MVVIASQGCPWGGLLVAVGVLFGWGCRESPAPKGAEAWRPEPIESPNVAKGYYRVGDVRLAGQPNEAGLDEWKEEGVRTVINLRPDEELGDFDERRLVEERGMAYVQIPVTSQGKHRLTDATVDAFLGALEAAQGPVVVHCASAHRVSALWAVYLATKKGVPPEQALELARSSGMREGYARDFAADYLDRHGSAPPETEDASRGEEP